LQYLATGTPAAAASVSLDHGDGSYEWRSPMLDLSAGMPGSSVVQGHVTGAGSAEIGGFKITQEYTTSGTYLDVTFTAENVEGSPTWEWLTVESAPLPAAANVPTPTPAAAGSEGAQ
jgi:hypothetical protein